jgi:hypothetical protein
VACQKERGGGDCADVVFRSSAIIFVSRFLSFFLSSWFRGQQRAGVSRPTSLYRKDAQRPVRGECLLLTTGTIDRVYAPFFLELSAAAYILGPIPNPTHTSDVHRRAFPFYRGMCSAVDRARALIQSPSSQAPSYLMVSCLNY